MKTKILSILFALTLCFSFSVEKANAQIPVTDGAHIGLNTAQWFLNISQWIKQVDEMIEASHIREGLQKIKELKQLQSLVSLAELLDNVACLSSDYSFYMNLGGNYHCLKFLNFQQVSVNLSLSTDLLFKVATVADYFSMNSEGRLSFAGQVREALEAASVQMKEYNSIVRANIVGKSVEKHMRKTYYSGSLAAYTRYTK